MACDDFKTAATVSQFPANRIVISTDPDYDTARVIANDRLDLKPCAIAYCQTTADVAFVINWCKLNNKALRVRSGGHHHEGMCSGDDVVIIDLSLMNTMSIGPNQLTVGPGRKLSEIYAAVAAVKMVLAGGGCGNVNIGGLVQGGGWGPSARKYGLTCDSLQEATVVLANGQVVKAQRSGANQDLFWALCGGGGGNFGVVTEYMLELHPRTGVETAFTLYWSKSDMLKITKAWMDLAPQYDNNITASCRLTVFDTEDPTNNKFGVSVFGLFYGDRAGLIRILGSLYQVAAPAKEVINEIPFVLSEDIIDSHLLFDKLYQAPPVAPAFTCDMPHPHKVSSCFPVVGKSDALSKQITSYILNSKEFPGVATYVSLMFMGGQVAAINSSDSAFFYRDADYIIQMQAWWSDKDDKNFDVYLNWIRDFRTAIAVDATSKVPITRGSFINFPDRTLMDGQTSTDPRMDLLKIYYGNNLGKLIIAKDKYDPKNLFDFEMGIPSTPNKQARMSGTYITTNNANPIISEISFVMKGHLKYNIFNKTVQGWTPEPFEDVPMGGPIINVQAIATSMSSQGLPYQNTFTLDNDGNFCVLKRTIVTSDFPTYISIHLSPNTYRTIGVAAGDNKWYVMLVDKAGELWYTMLGTEAFVFSTPQNLAFYTGITPGMPPIAQLSATIDQVNFNNVYAVVIDEKKTCWFNRFDTRYMLPPQFPTSTRTNFMRLTAYLEKYVSGDLSHIDSVRSVSCAVDENYRFHICLIDFVTSDLWYAQLPFSSQTSDYYFQNVQDEIMKSTPFTRFLGFTDVSVSCNFKDGELHVFAANDQDVICHTIRDKSGNWARFSVQDF